MNKIIDAIDALVNDMIDSKSAPNYKGWIVADENSGDEYIITVQLKDGESPSQQLAASKAEVDELVEVIECLIIDHGVHDSYDGGLLPDSEQSLTVRAAIKLLAKYKDAE